MYVAQQVMDETTAEVLAGLAPIRELPEASSDMAISELRDLRSMRLLQEFFPVDPRKRHLLRRALSENPPSQLSAEEIKQRARTWSALTSESYPVPWNPRLGQVFSTRARDGISLSGRRLPELLAAADTDDVAFDELVSYRAAHWLASFGIIEPDRGSLDGQEAIGDTGERVRRSRRTVMNCLQALRHEKSRQAAVGLLKSLAAAMDEGDRRPWRVSSAGKELVGREMTPLWFDDAFPKDMGTRPRRTAASGTSRTVVAPGAVVASGAAANVSAPLPAFATPPSGGTTAPSLPVPAASPPSLAPAPGGAVPAQTAASPSAPDNGAGTLTPDALVGRMEELIMGLHAASMELGDVLSGLEEESRAAAPDRPVARDRADAAVRLLNQTLSRLRKLPELMEDVTEPE
ncbi:Phage portal protein OS=Streptomyces alboniger OX=132473 GN=CP975_11190 PE=4 SV=1 [Streptomyces alboniger]